ncbi:hypothetical protein ACLMJK_000982 [Lecanora helva]
MSSRLGMRLLQCSRNPRATIQKTVGRRYQVTDAPAAPSQGLVQRLWNSPVGVKTVHFWYEYIFLTACKSDIKQGASYEGSRDHLSSSNALTDSNQWSIVLAGISDLARPAESLSFTQNIALTATGVIWTRWCFVIKPRNILLATVNFFLGCVGVAQVTRIFMYQRSLENKSVGQIAKEDAKEVVGTAKGVVENPEGATKKAVN